MSTATILEHSATVKPPKELVREIHRLNQLLETSRLSLESLSTTNTSVRERCRKLEQDFIQEKRMNLELKEKLNLSNKIMKKKVENQHKTTHLLSENMKLKNQALKISRKIQLKNDIIETRNDEIQKLKEQMTLTSKELDKFRQKQTNSTKLKERRQAFTKTTHRLIKNIRATSKRVTKLSVKLLIEAKTRVIKQKSEEQVRLHNRKKRADYWNKTFVK